MDRQIGWFRHSMEVGVPRDLFRSRQGAPFSARGGVGQEAFTATSRRGHPRLEGFVSSEDPLGGRLHVGKHAAPALAMGLRERLSSMLVVAVSLVA